MVGAERAPQAPAGGEAGVEVLGDGFALASLSRRTPFGGLVSGGSLKKGGGSLKRVSCS